VVALRRSGMLGNAKAVRQSPPRLRTIQLSKNLPAALQQAVRAANRLGLADVACWVS
jgi:hypothetical protein